MFKRGEIATYDSGKKIVILTGGKTELGSEEVLHVNHPDYKGDKDGVSASVLTPYPGPTYEKDGRRFVSSGEYRLVMVGDWYKSEGGPNSGEPIKATCSYGYRAILLPVPDLPEEHPIADEKLRKALEQTRDKFTQGDGNCGLCAAYYKSTDGGCDDCPFPGTGNVRCQFQALLDGKSDYQCGILTLRKGWAEFYTEWLETGEAPSLPYYTKDYKKEEHPCDFCGGAGELLTICERCHGTGELTKPDGICPTCKGGIL